LPNGEINHSSVITLLDRDGRIVAQTSILVRIDRDFSGAFAKGLRAAEHRGGLRPIETRPPRRQPPLPGHGR
jgi:hypothetical protein